MSYEESGVCFPFSLWRFGGVIGPLGWVESVCAGIVVRASKFGPSIGGEFEFVCVCAPTVVV